MRFIIAFLLGATAATVLWGTAPQIAAQTPQQYQSVEPIMIQSVDGAFNAADRAIARVLNEETQKGWVFVTAIPASETLRAMRGAGVYLVFRRP